LTHLNKLVFVFFFVPFFFFSIHLVPFPSLGQVVLMSEEEVINVQIELMDEENALIPAVPQGVDLAVVKVEPDRPKYVCSTDRSHKVDGKSAKLDGKSFKCEDCLSEVLFWCKVCDTMVKHMRDHEITTGHKFMATNSFPRRLFRCSNNIDCGGSCVLSELSVNMKGCISCGYDVETLCSICSEWVLQSVISGHLAIHAKKRPQVGCVFV
jgi:hypothetical protein